MIWGGLGTWLRVDGGELFLVVKWEDSWKKMQGGIILNNAIIKAYHVVYHSIYYKIYI